jgi:hypothetical protein
MIVSPTTYKHPGYYMGKIKVTSENNVYCFLCSIVPLHETIFFSLTVQVPPQFLLHVSKSLQANIPKFYTNQRT